MVSHWSECAYDLIQSFRLSHSETETLTDLNHQIQKIQLMKSEAMQQNTQDQQDGVCAEADL